MLHYQKLTVWQKSTELILTIYKITENFPKREWFGLANQIRRSSVSIASNIAEGNQRHTRPDRLHFLDIAYGSCAKVTTQLIISHKLKYISTEEFDEAKNLCDEIGKMLNTLTKR